MIRIECNEIAIDGNEQPAAAYAIVKIGVIVFLLIGRENRISQHHIGVNGELCISETNATHFLFGRIQAPSYWEWK